MPLNRVELVLWGQGILGATAVRGRAQRTLIARGDFRYEPSLPPERSLFRIMGQGYDPLPFAAATHAADVASADSRFWVRADPVHLLLGHQQAFLSDPTDLALSATETQELAEEIGAVFAYHGFELEALCPNRWYVSLDRIDDLATIPVKAAIGTDALASLPAGRWRVLLTEVQMVLYAARVNRVREDQGQLPVNSLWLWGEGRLAPVTPGSWAAVRTCDLLASGLARAADCPVGPPPRDVDDALSSLAPGRTLITLPDCSGVRGQTETLEREWFKPLLSALRRGVPDVLAIYDDSASLRVTASQVRRWWRRGG